MIYYIKPLITLYNCYSQTLFLSTNLNSSAFNKMEYKLIVIFITAACLLLTMTSASPISSSSAQDAAAAPAAGDSGNMGAPTRVGDMTLAELFEELARLSKLHAGSAGSRSGSGTEKRKAMWLWTPQGFSTMDKDLKDGEGSENNGKIMRYGK